MSVSVCDGRRKVLSPAEPVLFLFCRLQDLERTQQALVDTHHGTCVVELTTVVRCAEECD